MSGFCKAIIQGCALSGLLASQVPIKLFAAFETNSAQDLQPISGASCCTLSRVTGAQVLAERLPAEVSIQRKEDLARLNLTADATIQEIKTSINKMLVAAHPDRGGDGNAYKQFLAVRCRLLGIPKKVETIDADWTAEEKEEMRDPYGVRMRAFNAEEAKRDARWAEKIRVDMEEAMRKVKAEILEYEAACKAGEEARRATTEKNDREYEAACAKNQREAEARRVDVQREAEARYAEFDRQYEIRRAEVDRQYEAREAMHIRREEEAQWKIYKVGVALVAAGAYGVHKVQSLLSPSDIHSLALVEPRASQGFMKWAASFIYSEPKNLNVRDCGKFSDKSVAELEVVVKRAHAVKLQNGKFKPVLLQGNFGIEQKKFIHFLAHNCSMDYVIISQEKILACLQDGLLGEKLNELIKTVAGSCKGMVIYFEGIESLIEVCPSFLVDIEALSRKNNIICAISKPPALDIAHFFHPEIIALNH